MKKLFHSTLKVFFVLILLTLNKLIPATSFQVNNEISNTKADISSLKIAVINLETTQQNLDTKFVNHSSSNSLGQSNNNQVVTTNQTYTENTADTTLNEMPFSNEETVSDNSSTDSSSDLNQSNNLENSDNTTTTSTANAKKAYQLTTWLNQYKVVGSPDPNIFYLSPTSTTKTELDEKTAIRMLTESKTLVGKKSFASNIGKDYKTVKNKLEQFAKNKSSSQKSVKYLYSFENKDPKNIDLILKKKAFLVTNWLNQYKVYGAKDPNIFYPSMKQGSKKVYLTSPTKDEDSTLNLLIKSTTVIQKKTFAQAIGSTLTSVKSKLEKLAADPKTSSKTVKYLYPLALQKNTTPKTTPPKSTTKKASDPKPSAKTPAKPKTPNKPLPIPKTQKKK